MSQGFDAEPQAEVVQTRAEPETSARVADEEKVACKCPGCDRQLKIRRKYFGTKVSCKLCGHRFLARPSASQDDSAGAARGVEAELARLTASFGRWKVRAKETQAESARLSQNLAAAMATLLEQSMDLAAIQDLVAALHQDLGQVDRSERPDPEILCREIADEVVRRLAHDRDAAEVRWESLRHEVDELRRRNEELERGGIEARAAAATAAARFEQATSQIEQLRERVGVTEQVSGEWATLRAQVRVLTDQAHAITLQSEDQATESRTSLAAVRTEQAAAARTRADQETRLDRVEATLAHLDAAAVAHRDEQASRWTESEAQVSPRWGEVEALRQQFSQLTADQAGHRATLDSQADRLATIESTGATALSAVVAQRDDHALTTRELRDDVQRLAAAVASLQTELATHRLTASGIAPLVSEPSRIDEPPRPAPSPEVRSAPLPTEADLDWLIGDLARERIGDGHLPAPQGPPVVIPPSVDRPPSAEPASPPLDAEGYHQSALRYDQAMRTGRYPDAEREAQRLVQSAAARMGESSLEHALWLRNLALSLLRTGQPAESRASLLQALAICELQSDRTPRIVCLLDLADYHGELREFDLARATGERALALLDAEPNPIGPLRTRVRNLMARIGAFDSRPLATNSIMISA